MSVAVVWFKRDLRVTDHLPLRSAIDSGLPVLPIFILEPELLAEPDSSARQYAFVLEALSDLGEQLAQLGLALHTPISSAKEAFTELQSRFGSFRLFSHEETGNSWTYRRDLAAANWCRRQGIIWQEYRQNGVIRRMKSRDGWAEKWDSFMAEPICDSVQHAKGLTAAGSYNFNPAPLPSLENLHVNGADCAGRLPGKRAMAESLLESFLHQRGRAYRREMSSPITAEDSCSRLAPYLAWGLISTKEVTQRTWARINDLKHQSRADKRGWLASLNAYAGRLHWRCHFMQKLEDQPDIETHTLHPMYESLRPRPADALKLAAWKSGHTGYPFLDAAIRYLDHHGWINFRMRAMIMAVASYHLWLDWRDSAAHLAQQFVDYEAGIHWPQVQMQSGTTGMNTIRIYNPLKQGYDQDPDGHFIRQWMPELASVPDAFLHEPWKWPQLGKTGYPQRIFDHEKTARMARDKVWAVRQAYGFRDTRDQLLTKHASRRGRDKLEGPRKSKRTPASKNDAQFSLF